MGHRERVPRSDGGLGQHTAESFDEQQALTFATRGLLIDGASGPAASGRTLGVEDPATGRTLMRVADAEPRDRKSVV